MNRNSDRSDVPVVLLVSGMDPTGGAGMSADIRTCTAFGVYPMSCVTALTVQNYRGVSAVRPVSSQLLAEQLEAIYESATPAAVKIGMIPNAAQVRTLARVLKKHGQHNVVLDPVLTATAGGPLTRQNAAYAMLSHLLPLTDIITPNAKEYDYLAGLTSKVQMSPLEMSLAALLRKGGDVPGDQCSDSLRMPDGTSYTYSTARVPGNNLHGTGCVLSSAIAANLALGFDIPAAVRRAKNFLTSALRTSSRCHITPDYGPALTLIN